MSHQTAAMLIIGNEVLSGRTREANAWHAAGALFERGCKLGEIVVVPDEAARISSALNRLRGEFGAVITSGGIGPTHDDITMAAVAEALGRPLVEDDHVVGLMRERYGEAGMNEGRRRMTRVPEGARLIECARTIAPGAHVENVYVLAGVPEIFRSQLESVLPDFGDATHPFLRREIDVAMPESLFAAGLERLQQRFPDVEIGSYPVVCGRNPSGKVCISGRDPARIEAAIEAVNAVLDEVGAEGR